MSQPGVVREAGFTLIELMVTLAVMAILLVAATPSFVDFFDKSSVRGAADSAISLIGNARAEAVKTDLGVNISMAGTGTSWCLGANSATPPIGGNPVGVAATCTCTDATQCIVSGQRTAIEVGAYPGVSVGALPAPLIFDSKLGTITPLGVREFTLTSPRGKYDLTVQVNALGQARLCVPPLTPLKRTVAGVAAC